MLPSSILPSNSTSIVSSSRYLKTEKLTSSSSMTKGTGVESGRLGLKFHTTFSSVAEPHGRTDRSSTLTMKPALRASCEIRQAIARVGRLTHAEIKKITKSAATQAAPRPNLRTSTRQSKPRPPDIKPEVKLAPGREPLRLGPIPEPKLAPAS